MDLRDRRGGDRLLVELGEQFGERLAEVGLDDRLDLAETERRDAVLERAELVDDLGREQIGPRLHHLAELDERRAERAHRLA